MVQKVQFLPEMMIGNYENDKKNTTISANEKIHLNYYYKI